LEQEKSLNQKQTTKSAFVAIVGKPNVGKSSLLNKLLGEKLAIVTSKPQTTRTRITGVLTRGATQFVFTDTPGFHNPKTRLSDEMDKAVTSSIQDVDAVIFVVEPVGRLTVAEHTLIENIKARDVKSLLVINKIDLLRDKSQIAARIAALMELHRFDAVVPVSVLRDDGVSLILQELEGFATEGPHFFPDDTLTDQPERVIAAEMIREQLLLNFRQEIPHGTAVVVEKLREREDKALLDIEATIYCEKASHKGIIIGKNGAALKETAALARAEMERFFGEKVNLQCWVKIKEGWRNKESDIRNFGLSAQ